jgi:cytochrome c oxidase assembly protein subunit 15
MSDNKKIENYQKAALGLLLYTLLVILWGAWVRISHSGDGCGDHWPLCHGEFIPGTSNFVPEQKTWVEYSHRLMSGTFGLVVIWFFWRARKIFPSEHPVRKAALAVLIFMITEALLGAKLVLMGLVMQNDSPMRAFSMSAHMLNSLLLVGAVALLWELSRQGRWQLRDVSQGQKFLRRPRSLVRVTLGLFLVLAVSGAIASLASTLFPSQSLLEGLKQDLNPDSHFLIRWRVLHPALGLLLGGGLSLMAWMTSQLTSTPSLKRSSLRLSMIAAGAVVFGGLTLLSLAPNWMKLAHLLMAHTLWISVVIWGRNLIWKFEPEA